ncbi:MAG: carbohydrate-binding protein [Brevinematales bacterium]
MVRNFLRVIALIYLVGFVLGCSLDLPSGEAVSDSESSVYVPKVISTAKSDPLTSFNSSFWEKADWNNGSPFGCAFNPNNITFSSSGMTITLNNTAYNGKSYSGGEYRSKDTFTYGIFRVTMSTFTASGTVQSFFLYTGTPTWDEIDVEKIGTKGWQYNYYKDGRGGHEYMGNGSTTIEWAPNYIKYGGTTVYGSPSTLPSHPMQVMMNVWCHDGSATDWLGTFTYNGPYRTTYRDFSYTPISTSSSSSSSSSSTTLPRIDLQAWSCNASSGVTIWSGGVGSFDPGDWIRFDNVDLKTGYNNFSIEYATTVSGSLEVRLDSAKGTLVGTVNYSSTGDWGTYKWTGCSMDPNVAKGVHTIYVKGKSGAANLARITINRN